MDTPSPFSDLPALHSTEPKETKKPASYTTVGSIYDPGTITPLKPPTRRCRAQRWPPAYQSPAGDSVVAAAKLLFPRKDRTPPTTPSAANQYSPLQQNNDRAVSPLPVTDQKRNRIGNTEMVAPPNMRSGNVPPTPGLVPAVDKRAAANINDVASNSSEEALVSQFRVKTLKSLASYPNPMQRAAKNVLQKARQPAMAASVNNPNRGATLSPLSYTSSDIPRDAPVAPLAMRTAQTDSAYPSVTKNDSKVRAELSRGYKFPPPGLPDPPQWSSKRAWPGFDGISATLSSGPGAPRPLTAGPPGQRQYKPSTFEATIKALHEGSKKPQPTSDDSSTGANFNPAVSHGRPVNKQLQAKGASPKRATSIFPYQPVDKEVLSLALKKPTAENSFELVTEPFLMPIRETLPPDELRQYFPDGLPPNYKGRPHPISFSWPEKYPIHRQTSRSMTSEELAARNAKVNAAFYAGTDGLSKPLNEVVRENEHRTFERSVGIIGEERERARSRRVAQIGNYGRVEHPHISLEEANRQEERKHAEPLLTMAYASLVGYKDGDDNMKRAMNHFGPVESKLIDRSTSGRKSFFEKAKKPKKVFKPRPRKGELIFSTRRAWM